MIKKIIKLFEDAKIEEIKKDYEIYNTRYKLNHKDVEFEIREYFGTEFWMGQGEILYDINVYKNKKKIQTFKKVESERLEKLICKLEKIHKKD